MGGKALKHSALVRKPAAAYEQLKTYVVGCFATANLPVRVPLEVPGKLDFGDLDLLLHKTDTLAALAFITATFAPTEIVHNGPFTSFNISQPTEYDHFQIDLIFTDTVEMSYFYLSYGDVGGILGRLANAYGIKIGMAGMWCFCNPLDLHTRDVTQMLASLPLSSCPRAITTFLGGDYTAWERGFATENAIFMWLAAFRRLSPGLFQVLNHTHRVRQQQRPMYGRFLEFLGVTTVECATTHVGECVENLQPLAIDFFHKEADLLALQDAARQQKQRHAKFNGSLFHGEGAARGLRIQAFKALHPNLNIWIDQHTLEEVHLAIAEFEKGTA